MQADPSGAKANGRTGKFAIGRYAGGRTGRRKFAGGATGGFLLRDEGEENRGDGGVGAELEKNVGSPDWGFWQAELATP